MVERACEIQKDCPLDLQFGSLGALSKGVQWGRGRAQMQGLMGEQGRGQQVQIVIQM